MRAVLDTNVLVSGIFWAGTPFQILELWISDRFELIISEEIFFEYSKVFLRISKSKRDDLINHWLLLIAQNAHFIKIKKHFKLSVDADDDKFIDCALSGNAKYIVSGDSHLLDLKSIFNVQCISPSAFIKKYRKCRPSKWITPESPP